MAEDFGALRDLRAQLAAAEARASKAEADLDQVVSTVIEYHDAVVAADGYEPEVVRIDDPVDKALELRLNTVAPAFFAIVRERKVPSRNVAKENAALRAELAALRGSLKRALGEPSFFSIAVDPGFATTINEAVLSAVTHAALNAERELFGNPETGSTEHVAQGEAGHPTESTRVEPVSGRRDPLSFAELRATNVARCETHYHLVDAWSLSDWLTAVAGELGELAGVIKNIRRRADERGNGHAIPESTIDQLADEAADVVIYLDLLCERAGVDLGAAVRRKFNRVSTERLKDGPLLPGAR